MLKNFLLNLILPIFLSVNAFTQEITVSKVLPESKNVVVGVWKSKIISGGGMELTVVDTALANPVKEIIKIGPQIETAKKVSSIHCFIHNDFLYEVYFVIPEIVRGQSYEGYNVIVKRNLETMRIEAQKRLEHLHAQMKFVKTFDKGFYFCFGDSYSHFDGSYYINGPSPVKEIIPRKVYGFSYDLDELWSMALSAGLFAEDRFMNDIFFDEEHLMVPVITENYSNGVKNVNKRILNLTIANMKGKVAELKLNFDLEDEYTIHTLRVKYDNSTQKIRGVLLVSKQKEDGKNYVATESGYLYLEWDEAGKLVESIQHKLKTEEMFHADNKDLTETDFNFYHATFFVKKQIDLLYFDILNNGEILCVVNNICKNSPNKTISHSKFALCLTKEGRIKWSSFLPYSENGLYEKSFCTIKDEELHLFTREFTTNFSSGNYVYKDTKESLSGEVVVIADRVLDLNNGEIISHNPILSSSMGKFEPSGYIHQFKADELIARYRNSRSNQEKLVIMKF